MPILTAGLAGLIFGLGLILSGMADPAKVLGFLDLLGPWDPSLALVMAGAIGIGLIGFWLARPRDQSLLGASMQWPTATRIDLRLVLGSITFGVGWGLAGYCPGPALVAMGSGQGPAFVFVIAMLAGMALFEWLEAQR